MVFGPENPIIWVLGPLGHGNGRKSQSKQGLQQGHARFLVPSTRVRFQLKGLPGAYGAPLYEFEPCLFVAYNSGFRWLRADDDATEVEG